MGVCDAVNLSGEASDDGRKDRVGDDKASSAEHEWLLASDSIEHKSDEARQVRSLAKVNMEQGSRVQEVGNGTDGSVDTLDEQSLAAAKSKSLVHRGAEVVDDCPHSKSYKCREKGRIYSPLIPLN